MSPDGTFAPDGDDCAIARGVHAEVSTVEQSKIASSELMNKVNFNERTDLVSALDLAHPALSSSAAAPRGPEAPAAQPARLGLTQALALEKPRYQGSSQHMFAQSQAAVEARFKCSWELELKRLRQESALKPIKLTGLASGEEPISALRFALAEIGRLDAPDQVSRLISEAIRAARRAGANRSAMRNEIVNAVDYAIYDRGEGRPILRAALDADPRAAYTYQPLLDRLNTAPDQRKAYVAAVVPARLEISRRDISDRNVTTQQQIHIKAYEKTFKDIEASLGKELFATARRLLNKLWKKVDDDEAEDLLAGRDYEKIRSYLRIADRALQFVDRSIPATGQAQVAGIKGKKVPGMRTGLT
jgi:hypothetical protein